MQVTAGTVNYEGALTVRATSTSADSTLAGIAGMVAAAQGQEAPVQRLADSVAGRFCFSVMAAAAATFTFWTLAGKRAWSPLTLQYCKPGLLSCLCRASAEVEQLSSLISLHYLCSYHTSPWGHIPSVKCSYVEFDCARLHASRHVAICKQFGKQSLCVQLARRFVSKPHLLSRGCMLQASATA